MRRSLVWYVLAVLLVGLLAVACAPAAGPAAVKAVLRRRLWMAKGSRCD